jgi:hypothetical protein
VSERVVERCSMCEAMTLRDSSCQDAHRSFLKSAHLKRQLAPLSLHDSDTITYSVTPPRQNSIESDRPTHIFTDTQSKRQCCTRISPLLPTLHSCSETTSFSTLLATNDGCLQTAPRLDCDHTAFRLSLSRDRKLGSDLFWQSLFWAFW